MLGFGFFGISLIWPIFNNYVPIFLKEEFLLSATLAAILGPQVVGVLVEVPVMLSLVAFANRTQHWFPKG